MRRKSLGWYSGSRDEACLRSGLVGWSSNSTRPVALRLGNRRRNSRESSYDHHCHAHDAHRAALHGAPDRHAFGGACRHHCCRNAEAAWPDRCRNLTQEQVEGPRPIRSKFTGDRAKNHPRRESQVGEQDCIWFARLASVNYLKDVREMAPGPHSPEKPWRPNTPGLFLCLHELASINRSIRDKCRHSNALTARRPQP